MTEKIIVTRCRECGKKISVSVPWNWSLAEQNRYAYNASCGCGEYIDDE